MLHCSIFVSEKIGTTKNPNRLGSSKQKKHLFTPFPTRLGISFSVQLIELPGSPPGGGWHFWAGVEGSIFLGSGKCPTKKPSNFVTGILEGGGG